MIQQSLIRQYLIATHQYPEDSSNGAGITLTLSDEELLLKGAPDDLIALADLLVSLALSGPNKGQHWHMDDTTLLDETSEIKEFVLSRR